jgi:hypothetical protein
VARWDEATQQCYYYAFLPQQPDLNWRNPEVVDAMLGILRFWFDRGVDGFRVDAYVARKPRMQSPCFRSTERSSRCGAQNPP